jgi:hypothetical protein
MTKTKTAVIMACLLASLLTIGNLQASERKDIGIIERSSLKTLLEQFGREDARVPVYLTLISGFKESQDTEEDIGWKFTLKCQNREKVNYTVILWIRDDWQRGRVISCKRKVEE